MINFEVSYRSIDNLKILSSDNIDFIKSRIKEAPLTSCCSNNTIVLQHLFNKEFETLQNL